MSIRSKLVALLFGALISAAPALADGVSNGASTPAPRVLTITRDLTVATGSVAYTGCGFSPRFLVASGGINGTSNFVTYTGLAASVGGGRGNVSGFSANSLVLVNVSFVEFFDATAANGQSAVVASYDPDGFTLTWTKTGTPTGTATVYVACMN